jgi:hypothetical protein
MKYKLLLVFFLAPFLCEAQESVKSLQLGFTLSPTLSWLTGGGNDMRSEGSKVGFSYGVIGDFGFARNYFFSTAFTLTSLNSEARRGDGTTDDYRLQYVEIPLSLKLKSNPTDMGRFYGTFGLGTGVNVSAKKDVTGSANNSSDDVTIGSSVNTFRLGLIAGAGAEWSIGRNLNAVTGVNFNNGFTKTFKYSEAKNPFITFQLGVFF